MRKLRRVTIARRELSALRTEKTIVLALLIQLFIAAFSSFLVVGLTSLYDPGSVEGGEIEVAVTGDAQDRLVAVAEDHDGTSTVRFADRGDAVEAFDRDEVDAVLSVTAGDRLFVDATVPAEDLRTTLIVVQLRELLLDLERSERADRLGELSFEPLAIPDTSGESPYFGFTYTILLPLLLFLPAFISGSVVVDSITEELERGTFKLLRVSPASLAEIVDGKAAAMAGLAPLQAALWLVLLGLNDIAIANPALLLGLVAAFATIAVAVGVVLGLVIGSRQRAQLLYSTLSLTLFAGAAVLPEHPATTAALLAADSATRTTLLHAAGAIGLAVVAAALTRWLIVGFEAESLG